MKKSLFTLLFAISCLCANAQLGYWVRMGFVVSNSDFKVPPPKVCTRFRERNLLFATGANMLACVRLASNSDASKVDSCSHNTRFGFKFELS